VRGRFLCVYALPEGTPIAHRLDALYQGRVPPGDPLSRLLRPVDMRGEVGAWGGVHITLLDALTVSDPERFIRTVREICSRHRAPTVTAKDLCIWSKKSLVLRCESSALDALRADLISATHDCIERYPLSDEMIQKAEWLIRSRGANVSVNLAMLAAAVHRYDAAGAPPIPASRHFRLGFLVKLLKEAQRAAAAGDQAQELADRALSYFLERGNPPWYATAGGLHMTLASGLTDTTDFDSLRAELEPGVVMDFQNAKLHQLAVMAEDLESTVTVQFFDWLTETPIWETRPGFKVVETAKFQ
jgi:hypothetical protein